MISKPVHSLSKVLNRLFMSSEGVINRFKFLNLLLTERDVDN